MSRLEDRLLELGYSPLGYGCAKYEWFNGLVHISLNIDKTKIIDAWVKPCTMRHDIELEYNIQAFNQLQNDLKELKKCQED